MRLTENQCEQLRDAILNIYPAQNKAALERLLSEKYNINLEYILTYSDIITDDKLSKNLSKNIHTNNNQQINEKIKILILKIPAKNLDLDREIYELKNAIRESKNSNLLSISDEIVYDTDDIRRNIANENPQIVHFCGHGLKNGSLKLGDSNSDISPEVLKSFFQGREDTIKCVLLNACHSEEATLAISQNINYAIGMNNEIIDNVAIEFAKGFYDGLGYSNDDNTYITAFNEGIRAISAKNISQKSVPVLKRRISYEKVIFDFIKQLNSENQIDDFIQQLKIHNPTNFLLREFISYYEYPLNEDELNKFKLIFQKVTNNSAIQSAYQKVFRDEIESDKNKIIDQLILNDSKNSQIPFIVQFANHLASILKRNENAKSEEIQGWLDTITDKFKVAIIDSNKDESSLRETYVYLLITVDDKENDIFYLYAEYVFEDENSNIIKHKGLNLPEYNEQNGSECNSFQEIPNRIKEYYDELYNQHPELSLPNQIPIELFIPIRYLANNLDKEWFCKNDFDIITPIIRDCNIVVRPKERINNKKRIFMTRLNNNFKKLNNSLSKFSDEEYLHQLIEIITYEVNQSNYEKISDVFLDENNQKIGVNLIHNSIPKIDFFRAILRGGIAIAFWRRCSFPEDNELYDIDQYLKLNFFKNNFRHLIEDMYKQRQFYSRNDDNSDNFYPIGFLCDNPNRIPTVNHLQRKI